ncbi:sensor histidine kinase [Planctobacterium marinum]|uniref:histidine kinase n=1 Tax=Planctobacterium marinum TaxID=1631968 RepID=A0AA48HP09_9ALTE|nr:two-component sensor histidine kinase [Planctobacterium marinum]
MYKRKLFFFGVTAACILLVALACAAISAHLTRENLKQSNIAQNLLFEHQQVSSISYRMFKQLTDEVIFGKNANQAHVRKKQDLIEQAINNIKRLEIEQREALGIDETQGSVEDTDELVALINEIIAEFRAVVDANGYEPLNQQERFRSLLEVKIDNEFREAINAAVTRQSRVVAAINARIDTLNTAMVWFTIGLGALSIPLLVYGCYWLFNQLYQPLILLRNATESITQGRYNDPIPEKLDEEFEALANDIKRLAQQLQKHSEQESQSRKLLEYEVEERTKELTLANQKLTNIDTRRRQFLADISHELRTPLTIIRGEAQVTLRLKSASAEDYQETLTAILQQSVNLSRLVDDLLLLTRAEMNQLQLDFHSTSVVPMLTSETNRWQKLHPNRVISLHCDPGLTQYNCNIDNQRIQQVISILLDNAVKYSPTTTPIEIAVRIAGNKLAISVQDHGDGISATEIENIFERFVRFSKHDGLGLGLPIAKAIVEAHGGIISVDSIKGEGAVFTVYLPVEENS